LLTRIALITLIMLIAASAAFAQSDEELLEALRTWATKTHLDQMRLLVPESFSNSGLSPSDIERVKLQLANDLAACFVDAVAEYAALKDVPLSDLISEPGEGITFDRDSGNEFEQLLVPCTLAATQAAGIGQ